MKKSIVGITLVSIFLAIIAAVYVYFKMNQPGAGAAFLPPYAFTLLVAGLPWTALLPTMIDNFTWMLLSICVNITALYFIGLGIENMYQKIKK